jgi:guanylate kinase
MSAGTVVPLVIHGPGGVGKDHVIERLGMKKLTSVTDRLPREGEVDGRDYYFVHSDIFVAMRAGGLFVEDARVLAYWKGILRSTVDEAMQAGVDFVVKTDIQGAQTWRRQLEGCVTVRLLGLEPEQPLEAHRADLVARLNARKAPPEEIALRLDELAIEYAYDGDDYTVVNPMHEAERAVARLHDIVELERHNASRPHARLHEARVGAMAR